MYVDELIEELKTWKALNAEVLSNGRHITRVAAGDGNTLVLVPGDYSNNCRNKVFDLEEALSCAEDRIEEDEAHIEALEDILGEAKVWVKEYLNHISTLFEGSDCEDGKREVEEVKNTLEKMDYLYYKYYH